MNINLSARKSRARKRRVNYMAISQPYGMSAETESSSPETLGIIHAEFLRVFIEAEQQREQAVIEAFLKES